MKKIIIAILILTSLNSEAQTDSTTLPITVILPVKAVVLYGSMLNDNPNWKDRKAPDYMVTLIGSGNLPDSIVNVTITAGKMLSFVIWLNQKTYGIIDPVSRSIFNNSPSMPGYTALFTQITNISNGAGAQKGTANYIISQYNLFVATQTALYNQAYTNGLTWIRN